MLMFVDKNMPNNQVTKMLRTQQSSDKNASYKYTFNLQQKHAQQSSYKNAS
jgi:hypothetical protein